MGQTASPGLGDKRPFSEETDVCSLRGAQKVFCCTQKHGKTPFYFASTLYRHGPDEYNEQNIMVILCMIVQSVSISEGSAHPKTHNRLSFAFMHVFS